MSLLPLVDPDGAVTSVPLRPAVEYGRPAGPLRSRVIYAAAHVVPLRWAENVPGAPAQIDWDATLAFRRYVWSWGLGVADAMDTAQRNMGLDPPAVRELIRRSAHASQQEGGGRLVVGVTTDQVDAPSISLQAVIDAYVEQMQFAEDAGAGVVIMASRHLARAAQSAADYEHVYRKVLARAGAPVILHWLGTAFDPQLRGYFGAPDGTGDDGIEQASETLLRIIEESADRVAGIKMSVLDNRAEVALRDRLPAGVAMFTGDDFNYVSLIDDAPPGSGAGRGYSDGLLGAFAVIAPAASAAVGALDAGDHSRFREILLPTQDLARQIFAEPTQYYKTGVAFMSWLNGHQAGFSMVGGLHAARSVPHLSRIVELANDCGALEDPGLAARRWHDLLAINGIETHR